MSNDQPIDNLLEEFEAELREQKARLQEEVTASIILYTKKCEDLNKKQINALKREIVRNRKIIISMPPCRCKFRPTTCNICGKIFKNRRTRYHHSKYSHCMPEMPLNSQPHTVDYQYSNYPGNGNGNSWSPLLPYPNYTPVANPSNSE